MIPQGVEIFVGLRVGPRGEQLLEQDQEPHPERHDELVEAVARPAEPTPLRGSDHAAAIIRTLRA